MPPKLLGLALETDNVKLCNIICRSRRIPTQHPPRLTAPLQFSSRPLVYPPITRPLNQPPCLSHSIFASYIGSVCPFPLTISLPDQHPVWFPSAYVSYPSPRLSLLLLCVPANTPHLSIALPTSFHPLAHSPFRQLSPHAPTSPSGLPKFHATPTFGSYFIHLVN